MILRALRARGWLRPRRLGCLFLVLIVLVSATLWMVGSAVRGVTAAFGPQPMQENPFKTVTPAPVRATSGSPTIERITSRGWLIVAIQEAPGLITESPRGSRNYTGFTVELVRLIARNLGVDPTRTDFKPTPLNQREGSLRRKEVDFVLGEYAITPQRRLDGEIAGPYLEHKPQLAVPADSPVTSLESLGAGSVCTPRDSPAAAALADTLGTRLKTRADLGECAALLGNGVQAIAGDEFALRALPAMVSGKLRMVGEPLSTIEYGIGLPQGDEVLRKRINAVLRQTITDGAWKRLYEKYLGSPAPTPPTIP